MYDYEERPTAEDFIDPRLLDHAKEMGAFSGEPDLDRIIDRLRLQAGFIGELEFLLGALTMQQLSERNLVERMMAALTNAYLVGAADAAGVRVFAEADRTTKRTFGVLASLIKSVNEGDTEEETALRALGTAAFDGDHEVIDEAMQQRKAAKKLGLEPSPSNSTQT